MTPQVLILVYFLYGLAFFSMGLMVAMEGGRSSDWRLRMGLRPLAMFGFVHAIHEWLEMFTLIGWGGDSRVYLLMHCTLAFSFLSLAGFGSYLILGSPRTWRVVLTLPLILETLWVLGLLLLWEHYTGQDLLSAAHAWTRYSLGIPGAVLAAVGLIFQQRAFRRAGLIRFGQDSLWAAIAFLWYGVIGQLFVQANPLPTTRWFNEKTFLEIAGFPVQLFRAVMAIGAAFFVIRFLRAFQVEAERKIAELQQARLQEARQREQLRAELFRRIVQAQEAERQRIARDLHDEMGQALTALGIGLKALSERLGPRKKETQTILKHLQSLTDTSLKELQRIIADLRPSHLDDLGLSAAIRWYTSRLQELTPLDIRLEIVGEERFLDDATRITVFRIIQEALTNVIKHAQATRAQVTIEFRPEGLALLVKDDGIGFDPRVYRNSSSRPTIGLIGMEERATLLGGQIEIDSTPGNGCEVRAFIPYRPQGGL